MPGHIRTATLALGAAACLATAIGPAFAEAENLRLRPHKEPATTCVDAKGKCPYVQAPRINKRVSTIPGTQNPDYGRPPVINNPLGKRAMPPIGIFGNPAISGK